MSKLLYVGVPTQFAYDVFALLKEKNRGFLNIPKKKVDTSFWKDGAIVVNVTDDEVNELTKSGIVTESTKSKKYNFYVTSVHKALSGKTTTYATDVEKVFNILKLK